MLCRAMLEETALRMCWRPLSRQFLWNILAWSSDSAFLLCCAAGVQFCPSSDQSHQLAFAVANVFSFFSRFPHPLAQVFWFSSLMLANCKLAKVCLPGFLENILYSLYVSLDTLSNSFCSLLPSFGWVFVTECQVKLMYFKASDQLFFIFNRF